MALHRFIVSPTQTSDPHAARLLNNAKAFGFDAISDIKVHNLFFVEGDLTTTAQQRLANELLHDIICETCEVENAPTLTLPREYARGGGERSEFTDYTVELLLRPGVTDPVAEQVVRGAELLNIVNVKQAASGQRFHIKTKAPLSDTELHNLARRLFVNPVIHQYNLGSITQVHFPQAVAGSETVEIIPLRNLDDQQLLQLSQERRAALDLQEMKVIQDYFKKQDRDPTDVEFETIAQTWSEHCSHKTFRATIQYGDETIKGLLNTFIRRATNDIAAPWVASAFVDNAGIIDFNEHYQLAFKAETHNHPSAIEPFGGANTGLGGVIRDVLGVSAKPIANTDVFCFGPQDLPINKVPEGTLHPRLIASGVIAGVQDYGNKTGIPTVNGTIWYDSAYSANPLVYCGCVGLIPKNSHPHQPHEGDRVIVLGGRTGRDGLRGATFSSMTMDAQTGEVAGASVQIGDPIIAKGLIEVITRARDARLYNAITDCGAGGLSSAVGEMGSKIGADVDLITVPLKYPGLAPWEIWLSEAQERMLLAVPPEKVFAVRELCNTYNIELTDIGHFTKTNRLIVRYQDKPVLQLDNDFLFEDMPRKHFTIPALPTPRRVATAIDKTATASQLETWTLKLLSHPNIASKEQVIRRYDHEIQAGTVVKPLTGVKNDAPSDACVIKPQGTQGVKGMVLANGLNPEFGKYDPYRMAVSVIDEAVRNAVAVGADPERIAILDNFCWGDPKRPATLGALVESCRGCYDGALHYFTPYISGKDSLNNEYVAANGQRSAIPGTLLISALGIIEDINHAVTMDFKAAGNLIYLLGETKPEFAGSHFNLIGGAIENSVVPELPSYTPRLYATLHQAMKQQLVRSCHDLSEGGLAVSLAEMCIGGRLGCDISLGNTNAITALFSESNGRLLVEIKPEQKTEFEKLFAKHELTQLTHFLGTVTEEPVMKIDALVSLPVEKLVVAWQKPNFAGVVA